MKDIDSFIVPLYEKVYLSAEDIERSTNALLRDPGYGLERNSSLLVDDLIVRICLTTSRAYKTQRRQHRPPNGLEYTYTTLPMPQFIWLSELATRESYASEGPA